MTLSCDERAAKEKHIYIYIYNIYIYVCVSVRVCTHFTHTCMARSL